jgi:hypothetical protein
MPPSFCANAALLTHTATSSAVAAAARNGDFTSLSSL